MPPPTIPPATLCFFPIFTRLLCFVPLPVFTLFLLLFPYVHLVCVLKSSYEWSHIFVFLWLTNPSSCKWQNFMLFDCQIILHCICIPHLYPFISRWTFGLFPYFGYCWYCCYKHWGACAPLKQHIYILDKYIVVQLLGCRRVLFSISWGTSILFSRVAAPACIATNNAKEVLLLRILANICCCLSC